MLAIKSLIFSIILATSTDFNPGVIFFSRLIISSKICDLIENERFSANEPIDDSGVLLTIGSVFSSGLEIVSFLPSTITTGSYLGYSPVPEQ